MKIDFVSDVVCPWCAIGLSSLQIALSRLEGQVQVDLHFQPFELNPNMEPEGEDIVQHISRKYGISAEQVAKNRQGITERGEAVGFHFGTRERTYNTFDAHRLLYWAGLGDAGEADDGDDGGDRGDRGDGGPGRQAALKAALLLAYHSRGENVSDHDALVRIAGEAGLDEKRARQILSTDEFGREVRERESFYQAQGISGVPAIIIDDRYLISGGQPPEVFEQSIRQIAEEAKATR